MLCRWCFQHRRPVCCCRRGSRRSKTTVVFVLYIVALSYFIYTAFRNEDLKSAVVINSPICAFARFTRNFHTYISSLYTVTQTVEHWIFRSFKTEFIRFFGTFLALLLMRFRIYMYSDTICIVSRIFLTIHFSLFWSCLNGLF